jgi:hypothetical protein
VTYAGFENESTLLEELYHRGLAQPLVAPNTARLAAQPPAADRSADRLPSTPAPSSPKKGGDLCPICTLIGLAGSLLPLSPPTLSLPVIVGGSMPLIAADRERILPTPNSFQARAPPIA